MMRTEASPILTAADARTAGCDGLPGDLPQSSYALLARAAERYGERDAISFFSDAANHRETRTLSYRSLFEQVTRAANLFASLGVGPGDVVALLLPNLPETHVALWGAEAAGIVFPLNPALDIASLAGLITAAEARLLVTTGPGSELYDKACGLLRIAPSVAHVVLVDGEAAPSAIHGVGVHALGASLAAMPSEGLSSARRIGPDDIASFFCTGGTTGLPKIAVRTHGQVIANAWMAARMFDGELGLGAKLFCGLPLFHVNAVVVTGLMPFLTGASILLGTPLGYRAPGLLQRFWEIVACHRIAGFSAVPTLLAGLLEQQIAGHDLSSLRFAVCGAAPLSAELLQRFERACNVSVVEGYGLTESACVASVNPVRGEHRPGSVGFALPAEDIGIVILNEQGRFLREAVTGEAGVVTIAGPNIFSGYLDARHNDGIWIERGDGRRWLNTGDLGQLDRDGYLWLTGRAKDVIIRGGHNIDPSIIEEALYAHPDVALAAAIGRPDAYAGEVPVAYVQLRAAATADSATLLAHAGRAIGERAAVPKAITIVESLPLTSIGKIHKPSLRMLDLTAFVRARLTECGLGDKLVVTESGSGGMRVEIGTSAGDADAIYSALERLGLRISVVER